MIDQISLREGSRLFIKIAMNNGLYKWRVNNAVVSGIHNYDHRVHQTPKMLSKSEISKLVVSIVQIALRLNSSKKVPNNLAKFQLLLDYIPCHKCARIRVQSNRQRQKWVLHGWLLVLLLVSGQRHVYSTCSYNWIDSARYSRSKLDLKSFYWTEI